MTIPFNKIVKFGQSTMLEKDLFNVSWILSRFCNYNCSYCWPYAHSSKPDHRPLEQYKKTIPVSSFYELQEDIPYDHNV